MSQITNTKLKMSKTTIEKALALDTQFHENKYTAHFSTLRNVMVMDILPSDNKYRIDLTRLKDNVAQLDTILFDKYTLGNKIPMSMIFILNTTNVDRKKFYQRHVDEEKSYRYLKD